MFIVGIDIAKRSHMVRVIDSEGRTVCRPFSIRNSCSGYNALLERLRKLTNHKSEFLFAMESTAHYWLALYTRLRKEGYQVVVLNPIQTDAMREMLMEENKTDEIDTPVIAETIRFGRYKASSVPQEKLLALRELCRNRFYLIDMGSDLKRKITALLDQVFPEFESQFRSIFGKTALAVLRQYPTPEKLSRAQTGKLTEVLQAASNGRFGEWKARQLKELARDSFGIPDCEGAYSALLLLYLGQFQSLQDAAAVLEKRIAELFSQFDSTLTSITGVGPVLGAVILSEIRDISCFASADKLAAYAGLTVAGSPVTTALQFLHRAFHINESPFPQTVQSSSNAGLRTAAGGGNRSDVHLASVPATGAECQITVHRQLVRSEAVIKNLSVDLKKLFIKIPHLISSCSANRIAEI